MKILYNKLQNSFARLYPSLLDTGSPPSSQFNITLSWLTIVYQRWIFCSTEKSAIQRVTANRFRWLVVRCKSEECIQSTQTRCRGRCHGSSGDGDRTLSRQNTCRGRTEQTPATEWRFHIHPFRFFLTMRLVVNICLCLCLRLWIEGSGLLTLYHNSSLWWPHVQDCTKQCRNWKKCPASRTRHFLDNEISSRN